MKPQQTQNCANGFAGIVAIRYPISPLLAILDAFWFSLCYRCHNCLWMGYGFVFCSRHTGGASQCTALLALGKNGNKNKQPMSQSAPGEKGVD